MVCPQNSGWRTSLIEGSPITVCRRCGSAYSAVVLGVCMECDRDDWELCADIVKPEVKKVVENGKMETLL